MTKKALSTVTLVLSTLIRAIYQRHKLHIVIEYSTLHITGTYQATEEH
jgi:hypothetical protein